MGKENHKKYTANQTVTLEYEYKNRFNKELYTPAHDCTTTSAQNS